MEADPCSDSVPPIRAIRTEWRNYVRTPEDLPLTCFPPELGALWGVSGVYFLSQRWHQSGRLLYVGMSKNIGYRMQSHDRAGAIPADLMTYFKADEGLLPFIELAYIRALCPPYNFKYNGDGQWSGVDRMERLVSRLWRGAAIPTLRIMRDLEERTDTYELTPRLHHERYSYTAAQELPSKRALRARCFRQESAH